MSSSHVLGKLSFVLLCTGVEEFLQTNEGLLTPFGISDKNHTPIMLLIMPFNLDLESAKKQSGYRDTNIYLNEAARDEQ